MLVIAGNYTNVLGDEVMDTLDAVIDEIACGTNEAAKPLPKMKKFLKNASSGDNSKWNYSVSEIQQHETTAMKTVSKKRGVDKDAYEKISKPRKEKKQKSAKLMEGSDTKSGKRITIRKRNSKS